MLEQEPGHVEGLGAHAAGEGVGEGVLPAPVLNHHLIVPEHFSALKQIIIFLPSSLRFCFSGELTVT